MTPNFDKKDMVRLRDNPQKIGVFDRTVQRGPRTLAKVNFFGKMTEIPIGLIEHCPEVPEDPVTLLREGRFSEPDRLRQAIAHIRLTGHLSDMIYSMEATNTDFHAHQFKPVLKMLASPTGSLLIADEVGLGKTIEAGLIWTELKARFDYGNLLVVCPKVLTDKWRQELAEKFSIDAQVMTASDVLERAGAGRSGRRGEEFAAVCGMQGLRPPKGWEDEGSDTYRRPASRLARMLRDHGDSPDAPLFDLVIVDEAHHMRNPETQTNRLGRMLQPVTRHLLFLSATPINLSDRDLFSLLSMVDPQTYSHENVLRQILEANEPLIRARSMVMGTATPEKIAAQIATARRHPLLKDNRQLQTLFEDMTSCTELDKGQRINLATRLEGANLLANTVNRTRRRDVEEFRVKRKPIIRRATMSDPERAIYEAASQAIASYAFDQDINAGFLSVTPQRMLASCMPAAMAHWRKEGAGIATREDGDAEFDGLEDPDDAFGPLRTALLPVMRQAPRAPDLETIDTKYAELREWIRGFLKNDPKGKIILFSTFLSTLRYLEDRLTRDGVEVLSITSKDNDRTERINDFRDGTASILLASEVGSEGIDLQFARTVVNYDMPWNPMKVEQRIGRVDRLGQEAEVITVVNFLMDGTIDARIYDRLYARLGICERALGGFEAIIGNEVKRLTPNLVSGKLSASEMEQRLDQTASALEQKRQDEDQMEREAAALIAHGDHVLNAIHAARGMHRWIGHADLARYIDGTLKTSHPGCEMIEMDEEGCYEIGLTTDCRRAVMEFCIERKLPRDRLLKTEGRVRCRLGRPPSTGTPRRREIVTITQSHPLLRYLTHQTAESNAHDSRPAVAARIRRADVATQAIEPGIYAVAVQYWHFEGTLSQERIAYAGMTLPDHVSVSDDVAEALLLAAAASGKIWTNADARIDSDACADAVENVLLNALTARHEGEDRTIRAQKEDRASIQLATLHKRVEEQIDRIEMTLSDLRRRKLETIVKANEGRIRKLREGADVRQAQIEQTRKHFGTINQLAVAVIEVTP